MNLAHPCPTQAVISSSSSDDPSSPPWPRATAPPSLSSTRAATTPIRAAAAAALPACDDALADDVAQEVFLAAPRRPRRRISAGARQSARVAQRDRATRSPPASAALRRAPRECGALEGRCVVKFLARECRRASLHADGAATRARSRTRRSPRARTTPCSLGEARGRRGLTDDACDAAPPREAREGRKPSVTERAASGQAAPSRRMSRRAVPAKGGTCHPRSGRTAGSLGNCRSFPTKSWPRRCYPPGPYSEGAHGTDGT